MNGTIYRITNRLNGMMYIGQCTRDIRLRINEHKYAAKSKKNLYLYNAMNKYGFDNFSIEEIDWSKDISILNDLEEYYIEWFNTVIPNGYNNNTGGKNRLASLETKKKISESKKALNQKGVNSPNFGRIHSETVRETMSKSQIGKHIGEKNVMFGKHHTYESKSKISLGHKGKNVTEQTKAKISKSLTGKMIGEHNGMFGKKHKEESKQKMSKNQTGKHIGENNGMFGKHHTEEVKNILSNKMIGRIFSKETKNKMSESAKKKPTVTDEHRKNLSLANNFRSTKVKCLNNGIVYNSIGAASRDLNLDHSGISRTIKGIYKSVKGYRFIKVE